MLSSFAGGRVLGARVGGRPTTVLGLHGWGRDHRDLLPALDGFPAAAVDLPGFGATPEPPEPWTTAQYADLVAEVVVADLDAPVTVLGHSFGGRVALRLAQAHPSLVAGLVVSGVPGLVPGHRRPARPTLSYRVARALHQVGVLSDARMEQVRLRHGSADYRVASPTMRAVLVAAVNETYDDALSAITGPVELVWGAADTAAPVATARAAVELLADGRLTIVDGVDHFTTEHAAGALHEAVRRLIENPT